MSLSIPSQTFELARKWSPVFVETGTHVGGGVLGAVMAKFERILTCDIAEEMTAKAKENMGTQFGRVRYFVGDSGHILPLMLTQAPSEAVVLLDAHTMADDAQGSQCPLRAELEALAQSGRKDLLVMVDDVDLCGTPRLGGITLDEVKLRLLGLNSGYQFRVLDGLTRSQTLLFAAPMGFAG